MSTQVETAIKSRPLFSLQRAKPFLGTLVEITASGIDEACVARALEQAFAEISQIHNLMSFHSEQSDVGRLNRMAYLTEVEVHPHTWRVLRAAQLLSQESGGLFDISVAGTLIQLGYLPACKTCPSPDIRYGWEAIMLLDEHKVRFGKKLLIDLSGIAKGYAVDLAIHSLQQAGMHSGLVNAGGDLHVFGESSQTIQVRHPAAHTQAGLIFDITQGAVATSAGYHQEQILDGKAITPLINPLTRQACNSGRSVTVLAGDCMTADALTKVVYANPSAALAVLKSYHARALILDYNPLTGESYLFDTRQPHPSLFS